MPQSVPGKSGISYDSVFDFPDLPTEEMVEPHSFRNHLIRVLCYTAVVPIFMLGLFQLQQVQRAMQEADQVQLGMVQSIADSAQLNLEATERVLQVVAQGKTGGLRRVIEEKNGDTVAGGIFDEEGQQLFYGVRPGMTPGDSLEEKLRHLALEGKTGDIIETDGVCRANCIAVIVKEKDAAQRQRTAVALMTADFLTAALERVVAGRPFNAVVWNGRGDKVSGVYGSDVVVQRQLTPQEKEELARSPEGLLIRTPGTRDVTQVRAYFQIPRLDWLISVSQPLKVRDRNMMASAETSGFFLLIAVILTFLIGSLMNRTITRSVNTLMEAVETFGKGGRFRFVKPQLEKEGITEFIELGERFERMADMVNESRRKLERLNAKLEEEVAERTFTLLSRNAELRALQQLLLPMQSGEDRESALKSHVAGSVDQFRVLLGLAELTFIAVENHAEPPEGVMPVKVELSGTTYGWLVAGQGAVMTPDRVDSLRRLANSLAIVLANNALVTQLATEHATLTTVFESMTDGVIILGRSGRVIYANEYACRLVNDGRPLMGIYGRQHIQMLYGQAIPDGAGLQHTRLVRRTTKSVTQTLDVVGFKVSDLPGFPGERSGWLIRDISREAGIDAMKENLVSVVAHELKTPVTALRLLTETVKHDADAGRTSNAEDVNELMDETLRLGQLIDDILDVSRIEGGAMKLDKRVIQVASLIDRAARLARARYPVNVEREIDPEAEVICADPLRLTQVFINLFVNAARYRKETQAAAECRVVVRPGAKGTVVISVTDQGKGIEPERLAKIFEPFYQADMTTRRVGGGAGLGLTIVKGITEAHHGEVGVQSILGKSSTFTVTIPA